MKALMTTLLKWLKSGPRSARSIGNRAALCVEHLEGRLVMASTLGKGASLVGMQVLSAQVVATRAPVLSVTDGLQVRPRAPSPVSIVDEDDFHTGNTLSGRVDQAARLSTLTGVAGLGDLRSMNGLGHISSALGVQNPLQSRGLSGSLGMSLPGSGGGAGSAFPNLGRSTASLFPQVGGSTMQPPSGLTVNNLGWISQSQGGAPQVTVEFGQGRITRPRSSGPGITIGEATTDINRWGGPDTDTIVPNRGQTPTEAKPKYTPPEKNPSREPAAKPIDSSLKPKKDDPTTTTKGTTLPPGEGGTDTPRVLTEAEVQAFWAGRLDPYINPGSDETLSSSGGFNRPMPSEPFNGAIDYGPDGPPSEPRLPEGEHYDRNYGRIDPGSGVAV